MKSSIERMPVSAETTVGARARIARLSAFAALVLLIPCGLAAKEKTPTVPPGTGGGSGGATTDLPTIEVTATRPDRDSTGIPGIDIVTSGWPGRDWGDDLFDGNDGEGEDEAPNPGKKCPTGGNPIVIANGNKIETDVDFSSNGEMPLVLARTWNRYNLYSLRLFGSWQTAFDIRLSGAYSGTTALWAYRSDGRTIRYSKDTDGNFYENKSSPVSRIVPQADGTYLLYGENRSVERYNSDGSAKEIKNEQGIGWTFTYSGTDGVSGVPLLRRVTHTNGRYLEFTWLPYNTQYGFAGRVSRVRDTQGNYIDYTYSQDAWGRLKTVTLPGSPATVLTYHYVYDDGLLPNGFLLTGKSYNGIRYSTFAYDAEGRGIKTEHAGGVERFTFAYTPGANGAMTTVETNPLGKKATYQFTNDNLVSITGQPSANCAASFRDITYDANGYENVVDDFEGNATDYDYDAHGHLLKKVEGVGKPEARTTTYVWDETKNRLTRETVAGLRQADYVYDASGRIYDLTIKNLSAAGVANQTRLTTYRYTLQASGLLATMTVDGPIPGAADAIVYTYSTKGDLASIKNSLGQITTYANYNELGLAGKITGINGEVGDYAYDERGRLKTQKSYRNGVTQTTTYEYDGFGRVAAVTMPDGVKRTYQYDVAGRVLAESVPEGGGSWAQTVYSYNAMSKPTSIKTQRVYVQPAQGTQP